MSIATEITRLQTAKTAIATAIGAKGVTVPPTTHIDGYAALVDQIASGGSGGSSGAPLEWSEAYWQNILDNAWTRPADWLALPNVGDTESKFVGLHAIHENSNFLALSAAGNYTVDWGDGTVENFNSGVTAYHQYDYNSAAFNGTLSSRGYKQAIVTVTPQAGKTFTSLNLNLKHSQTGLQTYSSGWLDILISGPSLNALVISGNTANVNHYLLEQAKLISSNAIGSFSFLFNGCRRLESIPAWVVKTTGAVDMSYMFNNCSSLQTVPLFNTAVVTNMSYMFQYCYSLQTVPLFNTAVVTNMSCMFQNCYSLQTVPLFNTQAVTSMSYMFYGCYSLQTVPLFNTAAVTNISGMFYNCYSLQSIPALNASAVTSSANLGNIFASCPSLSRIAATGFKYTFSVANCKLSAAALNEIYTNLPTVTGQTITVTGNWGTTSDDPSIATAKGWTVTG